MRALPGARARRASEAARDRSDSRRATTIKEDPHVPTPTFEELKTWAENYTRLWNAGDKEGWIANWRNHCR